MGSREADNRAGPDAEAGVTAVMRNAQESAGKAAALRSGGTLSLSGVHHQHFPRSDVEFGMRAGWVGGGGLGGFVWRQCVCEYCTYCM